MHFATIQEYRAMKSALKLVTEKQFNEAFGSPHAMAEIIKLYERFRPEFPDRAVSWDVGLNSMVKDLGDPYKMFYVGAYVLPKFHVHATLASAFDGTPETVREERNLRDADFALLNATACLLFAISEQNKMFDLKLDAQLDTCEKDVEGVFVTR